MVGAILFNRAGKVLHTDNGDTSSEEASGKLFLTAVTFLPTEATEGAGKRLWLKVYTSEDRQELVGESENAVTWSGPDPKVYNFPGVPIDNYKNYLLAFENEPGVRKTVEETPMRLVNVYGGGAVALKADCSTRMLKDANAGVTLTFETKPPSESKTGVVIGVIAGLLAAGGAIAGLVVLLKKKSAAALPPPPGAQ